MTRTDSAETTALVVGVTGIAGRALAHRLVAAGWTVLGLSRRAPSDVAGVVPVTADLQDADALTTGDVPDTPFHEDEARLPHPNFHYAQEDELWSAAERDGFTWTVHRAHTVIGHAVGNAMNMAQILAAQAAICRRTGRPCVFPGSRTQWEGLSDMTSADLLAEHLHWAATTPAVADTALNIVNGDVFRWRWMWRRLAADRPGPRAEGAGLQRVASWWHTDGDLGRDVECLTDMRRSRVAGFTGFRPTLDGFLGVFDELVAHQVVPAPSA